MKPYKRKCCMKDDIANPHLKTKSQEISAEKYFSRRNRLTYEKREI